MKEQELAKELIQMAKSGISNLEFEITLINYNEFFNKHGEYDFQKLKSELCFRNYDIIPIAKAPLPIFYKINPQLQNNYAIMRIDDIKKYTHQYN